MKFKQLLKGELAIGNLFESWLESCEWVYFVFNRWKNSDSLLLTFKRDFALDEKTLYRSGCFNSLPAPVLRSPLTSIEL